MVLEPDGEPRVALRVRGGRTRGTAREIRDPGEYEEARDAYCETVTLFDRLEYLNHRRGRPTPERIRSLHRRWFAVGAPVVVDLHTSRRGGGGRVGFGCRGIDPQSMLKATYLLPLKTDDGDDVDELAAYLRDLAGFVDEVIVVDGSSPRARETHQVAFGPGVRVLAPAYETLMGKVGNVCTGIEAARHEAVVIADDDVRYEPAQLIELVDRLEGAAVVRPQNYFDPLPWHARFDTARTLLTRITGGDWPGTLAVRRSAVLAAGGYAGDVMFENLELVRTVEATGGAEELALDLLVRRQPPTTAHFRSQQIRQAYDEFARPVRLLAFLAAAPAAVVAALTNRRALAAGAVAVTAGAEIGRRRAGGRQVFPASSVPLAVPWVLWRSLCSWAAVGARLRGGVRYRGTRLRKAATPHRELRRRLDRRQPPGSGRCSSPGPWPGESPDRPQKAARQEARSRSS